jgi:hypothetical protein
MHISDGTWPAPACRPMPALSAWLLTAFDAPPTGDADPTVDIAGTRIPRTRPTRRVRTPSLRPASVLPPKVQKLQLRPSRPEAVAVRAAPRWGIALGIASSATVLVAAMGVLSMVGLVALYLMA